MKRKISSNTPEIGLPWKVPQAPASTYFHAMQFPPRYENDPRMRLHGPPQDLYSVTLANTARLIAEHAEGRIEVGEGMVAAGMLRDAARLCDLLEYRERMLEEERRREEEKRARRGRTAARS